MDKHRIPRYRTSPSGLPDWKYMYTEQPKVTYLENPFSESHSLGLQERRHGASLALLRVLAAMALPNWSQNSSQRNLWHSARTCRGALKVRLGDSELTRMVHAFALDVAVRSRIGTMGASSHFEVLSKGYAEVEDWFAANLSSELGQFETGKAIESRIKVGRRHTSRKHMSVKAQFF